ncbi:hypothetical protein E3P92_00698 [Wallemia ichthyophaga]|nr:hypothetical protein E3P92_00698 [Wallemia ichthyophaga]TIB37052.1 hypothetical protein E3P84_00461 [Wallemia ichthyophaga]TIB43565.1 hypothetical protein E3P83_00604 [Wallemia ichthyophaga]TIB69341.1 hypothetical protein E3P77_00472 [Wallemia ichthyophaga]
MTILTLPSIAGVGKDFFICLILTLLGWIPGQIYNFFIQNIRDNTMKERTPNFAIKYKLVNIDKHKKNQQRNSWRQRYQSGINSAGIFDSRTSLSSENSAKHFDLPFNTGSGPVDSHNSSFVNDFHSTNIAHTSKFGSLFKNPFGRRRKDPNLNKNRWERSRISHEHPQIIDPDDDPEGHDGSDGPEEPVGMYYSAEHSKDNQPKDNGNLATDLRHE